ncbi:response regulator [Bacillus massiliglaciei]|uniref:response regulator n=1 Tax=Bacillus massiliglaciei TaxID=1816693 RepID=UPI000AFB02E4|nr:response regulator [Bacillus massiliglaciei]
MKRIRAVIAEDDFRVAGLHEKFLGRFGEIEVVAKSLTAKETLEVLEKERADLLLLDVYMPDELGSDLLPVLRERFEELDIIMITAAADKKVLSKALGYGVENFLIKPVSIETFNQAIQDYLNKKRLLSSSKELNQQFVDDLFNHAPKMKEREKELPKGIDPITLKKVIKVLEQTAGGLSAEQAGALIGASRTTARRYLEYLISVQLCKAEVEYGIGRPERKYMKRTSVEA